MKVKLIGSYIFSMGSYLLGLCMKIQLLFRFSSNLIEKHEVKIDKIQAKTHEYCGFVGFWLCLFWISIILLQTG